MTTSIIFLLSLFLTTTNAFIPLIDGGKGMPKLYDGWFNEQISKQASSAVSRAVAAGKKKLEVNFPPVPNVEEVKFGTPLNLKFGKTIVAKDLGIKGGYKPGSDISRQLIAYANMYWAKKIGPAAGGGKVCALTAESCNFNDITKKGSLSRVGRLERQPQKGGKKEVTVVCNPGGEETWDRINPNNGAPFVVLNNAYSTTYGLGNKRGYEEAYYVKRISKGWIYRSYPGPWEAYLEKPDGNVELLKSWKVKPELREAAELVRTESFKRFAINNDRWTSGFGGRL